MSVLVFDIGGTSMRIGIGQDGKVSQVVKTPTPAAPLDALAAIAAYRREHAPEATAVSGGVPGILSSGVIISSPHLPSWDGFAFIESLERMLSLPITLRNDAALAALGEAVYGAGKHCTHVAYLGIGTGVGGAYIVNGKLASDARGFEPGHHLLDAQQGETFERLVSGHALEAQYGARPETLPRAVYEELIPMVALGIYNTVLFWPSDIVVLGGSLMDEENGYHLDSIAEALRTIPSMLPTLPILARASLGDESGLHGALAQGG